MSTKIIIKSDEAIICPQCSKEFTLNEGIAKQTIEKYELEYENETQKLKLELSETANKEAEKNISKKYLKEIEELKESLEEKDAKIIKANQKIEKAKEEARKEALEENANEKKVLQEELSLKNISISEFQDKEKKLINEKKQLEKEKANIELQSKIKLDEEIEKIVKQAAQQKDEELKLKEIEYQKKLAVAQEANKDAEKSIAKKYQTEIEDLKESLVEKDDKIQKANQKLEKAKEEARKEALEDSANEKKSLEEKIKAKDNSLAESRDRELQLLKEKEKLEDEKANIELESKRQLTQEREKIKQIVSHQKDEEFKLKEAEYQKKLSDAQKANEELSKKLENKSQQFSGEVLEIILEEMLKTSFRQDDIQPVKKGIKGADVIQTVFNNVGQNCGRILWEAKRHENWSDKWIQKLKDDQIEANAEIAIIVTTVMPKECNDLFIKIDEIWVISDQLIKPIANTLRYTLIETTKQKLANVGKNEKMELLYDYLNSPQFVQKIKSVIGTFVNMKSDLDKEKNAIQRLWKKRETQIDRVANNMSSMIGELQGIAQDSLTQLNNIDELLLPEAEFGDEEAN